ncbi:hypothetical protein Tco_1425098 [Tanacetum coccineum]
MKGKGASSIAKQVKEEEASSTIKLEDLAKLVSNVQPCFKDLNSPKDDHVIIIEESDEENYQIHATKNVETEDSSVSKSSSPKYSLIQELTNQVLILQSQKNKLELKKNKVEAKAALLKAQPSFPNVEQLNELLVKSLKTKFSNILTARDLSNSLPTELKDISSKLNELTGKVQGLKKQVHDLEIELPEELNEIPTKLEDCLLSNVTKALNKFAQVLDSASSKDGDQSVPSAGQTNTMPAEGEKNTNQVAISQLFRRRAEKKDKAKKALSSEEAEKESTKSGSNDETTHMSGSTVESYKKKELKNAQKKIEEEAKAEAARREGEIRKEELIDLLGLDVVNKYYNDKLQYDKYCDKMLNRRAASRITNYDVLTKKGPITLKVYREDGTSEIILNFKVSDLHLGEWREVMEACPKRTGKGWEIIYKQVGTRMDFIHIKGAVLNESVLGMILFNSYHIQDFVTIEDFRDFPNTMLYTVQEIFFRLHQGPGLDDHARTFNSLLLAEIDKRNLNPLKQMRVIEQLRQ